MKIFASDFDGTIFFHEPLDPQLVKAIEKFRKEGNKFGLNTGRGLFSIEEIEEVQPEIPFDFYITDNGAILADPDKKIIDEQAFEPELLEKILEKLPKENLLFSIEGKYYLHPEMEAGRWTSRFPKWDYSLERPIHSISLEVQSHQNAESLAAELEKENWPINLHVNRYSIDITPDTIDKSSQFDHLKVYFNAPDATIIAAGDSYNDLKAFKKADQAFTFDYAPDVLKKNATVIERLKDAFEQLEKEEENRIRR